MAIAPAQPAEPTLTWATAQLEVTVVRAPEPGGADVPQSDPVSQGREEWRSHVLWVDDNPDDNTYDRQAFEAAGLHFTLALSTNEALDLLKRNKYAAIISDMGRPEGIREGYVLLDAIRSQGLQTPYFIYARSNSPEHKRETIQHGGQGSTNNAQELFKMIMQSVVAGR